MSSLKELQDLVAEKYGIAPTELQADASMREHGLDSLTLAEFLFEVEERLQVSLSDAASSIDTLSGLAEVIDGIRVSQGA